MSANLRGIIIGALGMLLLLILIALIVVLTGGYNVAATDRHNPIVGWALTTTMTNSVQGRASGIEAPSRFTPVMIEAGAGEYKAMCAHCHGGVGESRAEWAETMRPSPPALAHAAAEWSPEEVFWLVKHGVKMSGMPAFGPTHDDETLWNIAAFVKAMPEMSAEQYAEYSGTHGSEGADAHLHAEGAAQHAH
jgi:mono/diheme cytochrome c family protein|tara:strand:+ start:20938 stop:21513 length:576 start_codon:yes stop_codon:yes gene_type:complete